MQPPTPPPPESTVPLFPVAALAETLDFYEAIGFEVTYRQEEPYLYAAVQVGGIVLHFSKLSVWHAKIGVSLVFVPDVGPYHRAFADALRAKHGRVPTAGVPRLTRLRAGQTRFHLFDPSGNILLFLNREEPDGSYEWHEGEQSRLASALENAAFLRDTYTNDKGAATVLDKALAQPGAGSPVERARALAARAELAVAMGDGERAHALRLELEQMPLTDDDRERYRDELEAADKLERWLTEPSSPNDQTTEP